jgi:hypothetical protein
LSVDYRLRSWVWFVGGSVVGIFSRVFTLMDLMINYVLWLMLFLRVLSVVTCRFVWGIQQMLWTVVSLLGVLVVSLGVFLFGCVHILCKIGLGFVHD